MTTALLAHTLYPSTTGAGVTSNAIDTTGANLIVAMVTWYDVYPGVLSDNKGNTWVPLTTSTQYTVNIRIYYCLNPTVGTGHTLTYGSGVSSPSLEVLAFHLDNLSGFEAQRTGGGTYTVSATGSSALTPSVNGAVIVACAATAWQSVVATVDSGFTVADSAVTINGQRYGLTAAYLIQATAGAVDPTFTFGAGGPAAVPMAMATFVPSASTPRRALYLA